MNGSARNILIVVDVQNDFCPGGALAVPAGDAVVPVVNRLIGQAAHVVLTQDWHPPGHRSFASSHAGKQPFDTAEMPYGEQVLWPDHCVQETAGAAFHAGLDTRRSELVIRKGFRLAIDSYSTFFENDRTTPTGLHGFLQERGFDSVTLAGLAYDFCVYYSAMDARKLGYAVRVEGAGCRAIDLDGSRDAATRDMTAAGVEIIGVP